MSELSVRDTAARALHGLRCEHDLAGLDCTHEPTAWYTGEMLEADAVLAAVADHDGLADVLRAHTYHDWAQDCRCRIAGDDAMDGDDWAAHLADVVRAWMVRA